MVQLIFDVNELKSTVKFGYLKKKNEKKKIQSVRVEHTVQ